MILQTVSIVILIIFVQIVQLDILIQQQEYVNLNVISLIVKVVIYLINVKHVKMDMILYQEHVILKHALVE